MGEEHGEADLFARVSLRRVPQWRPERTSCGRPPRADEGNADGSRAAFPKACLTRETWRVMSSLLYGVRSNDPATFLAVTLVLTGVAAGASYIPARRAARIDPLVALRHD
jgi:hypothetical protein